MIYVICVICICMSDCFVLCCVVVFIDLFVSRRYRVSICLDREFEFAVLKLYILNFGDDGDF